MANISPLRNSLLNSAARSMARYSSSVSLDTGFEAMRLLVYTHFHVGLDERTSRRHRTYVTIVERPHMRITASKLRQDIYRILDEAIATGIPVEVMRKGTILRIVPDKRASKLTRLRKRSGFEGDPDEIIGMDWSKYWTELE